MASPFTFTFSLILWLLVWKVPLLNLKNIEQRLTVHKMLLLMPDGGRYFAHL